MLIDNVLIPLNIYFSVYDNLNSHVFMSIDRYQNQCSLQKSSLSCAWRVSRISYDGWWSPDTIATELRSHDRHDKNARPATRGACCPGSHGRQSPIKPDFEPGSVSWSNHKSIYLPFRAGMIKKFCYRDSSPEYPRYTDISLLSRIKNR